MKVDAKHIYGHQDCHKEYDNLDCSVQINLLMDNLAKLRSQQVCCTGIIILPTSSFHPPLGFFLVWVDSRLTHQLNTTVLHQFISKKTPHEWWIKRGRYRWEDIPPNHGETSKRGFPVDCMESHAYLPSGVWDLWA